MIDVDQAFKEEKFNFVANVILSEIVTGLEPDEERMVFFFQSLKKLTPSSDIKPASRVGLYFSYLRNRILPNPQRMLRSTFLFLRFYPTSNFAWRLLARCGKALKRKGLVREAYRMIGKEHLRRGEILELCQCLLDRGQFAEANQLAKFLAKTYPSDAEAKRLLWSSSIGMGKVKND